MYDCFIPIEARPEVTQELVCKAWAVAEALDSYDAWEDQSNILLEDYVNDSVARPSPT